MSRNESIQNSKPTKCQYLLPRCHQYLWRSWCPSYNGTGCGPDTDWRLSEVRRQTATAPSTGPHCSYFTRWSRTLVTSAQASFAYGAHDVLHCRCGTFRSGIREDRGQRGMKVDEVMIPGTYWKWKIHWCQFRKTNIINNYRYWCGPISYTYTTLQVDMILFGISQSPNIFQLISSTFHSPLSLLECEPYSRKETNGMPTSRPLWNMVCWMVVTRYTCCVICS